MQDSIFKAYDIRGIYNQEFNRDDVRLITRAYLQEIVKSTLTRLPDLRIVVARDMRQSSQDISETVINEAIKYGAQVDDIGLMPIEALNYICGRDDYDGGIMVTASHNPPKYGGLKMVTKGSRSVISGSKIKETIDNLQNFDLYQGRIRQLDVWQEYIANLLTFVDTTIIKPLKIVVDASNGMAGVTIPKLFSYLPQVALTPLFFEFDENFSNHSPNPLEPGALDKLIAKVQETGANLGAIFDVDADRVFFIDELGKFIRADEILLLLAEEILKQHPGCGIVYNVICSQVVPEKVMMLGGRPVRVKVGWKNIKESVFSNTDVMFGGELSGHYNFKKSFSSDEAFGALLLMLQILSTSGKTLSELAAANRRYAKGDEINLVVNNTSEILSKIKEIYINNLRDELDGLTVEFWKEDGSLDWWFNMRPSNTEPLLRITVETAKAEELLIRQDELISLVNKFNN